MAYGAVLRTPLPCVHYQTICIKKKVLTAALPPFVEAAASGICGREMGVMEASLKVNATHMAIFTSSGN